MNLASSERRMVAPWLVFFSFSFFLFCHDLIVSKYILVMIISVKCFLFAFCLLNPLATSDEPDTLVDGLENILNEKGK